jgi:uncharacterized lipoprotein YbaY/membrane-bound inhibitor of C-type lysozyme
MFRIQSQINFSGKSLFVLRLVVAGSLACLPPLLRAQEGSQTPPSQAPASTPASSTQNPVTNPQPVLSPDAAAKATVRRFIYSCDDGVKLTVGYSESLARVSYNGHVYVMKQVMSADGGRYSDGKLVWWSKGNGGFLAEADDGNSPTGGKQLAKNCNGVPAPAGNAASGGSTTGAAVSSGVVTGTVSYLYRIAMPPTAVAVVQLQDVSRADAAAPIIAEQKITFGDRQVPLPFELKFDPSTIDPRHRYAVRANILVDGVVRFHTDQAYPVITRSHPSKVDLVLKQPVDNPLAQP